MLFILHCVASQGLLCITSRLWADLKRRTEEELEKRSWSKALANLNTLELADLSAAIGEKLEVRNQRSAFEGGRGTMAAGAAACRKPRTPPIESRDRKQQSPRPRTRIADEPHTLASQPRALRPSARHTSALYAETLNPPPLDLENRHPRASGTSSRRA